MTTTGPLGPRYFIRLSKTGDPERGDLLQRRQRRPDARPAAGDRRRASSSSSASASSPPTTPTSSRRCRSSTRRSSRPRRAARAGTATTATGTATARPTGIRGRRAARAQATSGRRSPPSAASRTSPRATRRRGLAAPRDEQVRLRRRAHPRAGLGVPGSRGLPVRDRPHRRLDRVPGRRARGLGRPAHVVGGVVRAARCRPRRRAERRPAAGDLPALRGAHPGRHDPHRDESRRRLRRLRLPGHRDRLDGAGQHRLCLGNEHRHDLRDDERLRGRRPRWGASASRCRSPVGRACSTPSP